MTTLALDEADVRELSLDEVEAVSGGFVPLAAAAFIAGFRLGVAIGVFAVVAAPSEAQ